MAATYFFTQRIPLTPLKQQLFAGGIIGIMVFFILLVFQPFGTYEFSISNKNLFLFGYGVLNALIYMFFYAVGHLLFPRWFSFSKWNLMKEGICLILIILLMTLASLLYHHRIIGNDTLNLNVFIHFLKYSLAVATVPFTALYYQKWIQFKLTQRIPINTEKTENIILLITFESNNKNEPSVTLPENEILFIKSEGNYIELMQLNQRTLQRYLIRNTLNNVLAVLPDQSFCKIHRSFIVNLNFAGKVILNGSIYELSLTGTDQKLPVSRSMVKELKQLLQSRQ